MSHLLVIDREPETCTFLKEVLTALGHHVHTTTDAFVGIRLARDPSIELVFVDLEMSQMDGLTLLDRLHRDAGGRNRPIIVLCSDADTATLHQCLRDGAEDYLIKPFDSIILGARTQACLQRKVLRDHDVIAAAVPMDSGLHARRQEELHEIETAQLAIVFAMAQLAESRDPSLGCHLERVQRITGLLARRLMMDGSFMERLDEEFVVSVPVASVLHDIGKVAIPDRILLKPGPLSAAERRHMERHTTLGAATLRAILRQHPNNPYLRMGIAIAESHHERWDGTGYPHALVEDEIPLEARLVAVADVYDALTTPRCYRSAMTHDEAMQVMTLEKGKHFDPLIWETFVAISDHVAEECEEIDRAGAPAPGTLPGMPPFPPRFEPGTAPTQAAVRSPQVSRPA